MTEPTPTLATKQTPAGLEDKIGSIEPGKDADIAVWDKDMYTIPSADLLNLKGEVTIYRRRIVYQTR